MNGKITIDRRSLLAGGGAAFAAGLATRPAAALAASEALILAPARRPDGSFAVLIYAESGPLIREISLPARGHDVVVHLKTGRAVIFARRPGSFAVAFDIRAQTVPRIFFAPEDRHFYGHGAFSPDGQLLYATENDFEAGRGTIGIYDATGHYRRIGEFATRGVGPHEVVLMPDGKSLAIANGGIETHPDAGRRKLNLATMDPSLVFVDRDGHLLAKHHLSRDHHQLSIRHMAAGTGGAIWFGAQWQGDPRAVPPPVGYASLEDGLTLTPMSERLPIAMRGYVGSVAASRDGTIICASAPRGGQIHHWEADTRRYLGHADIPDSSGIVAMNANRFLASSGRGQIVETDTERVTPLVGADGVAFDNHLNMAQGTD